jgi:hypothetical protein
MTKKDELTAALLKVNDQLDDQPDDDLYVDFCTAVGQVTAIENGFIDVLKAATNMRDLQTQYFAAKKNNLVIEGNKLLAQSKAAEKDFDKLVRF